jgi:hypothetical protein
MNSSLSPHPPTEHERIVEQARNDRAGGAQLVYTMLQTGELVITDTCQNAMRDRATRPR